MKEFKTEATTKTPEIIGDIDKGMFSIKGKCIPEDARDFFIPFRDWLINFTETTNEPINVEIDLEYFNTSTSSILLDIFKHLGTTSKSKEVKVKWIYEEDDIEMEEVGEDYRIIVGDFITLESKEIEI